MLQNGIPRFDKQEFKPLKKSMKTITPFSINKKYFPALGKVFSPGVIENIVTTGNSALMTEVCKMSGFFAQISPSVSLGDFFDTIYTYLFENYRNEYIYKNTIANKVLLGRHSLNTAQMLTEFRIGKCKADVVVLNGTTTAYEIKSEYDSFRRLERQITEYRNVFDFINVITSNCQVNKLRVILPKNIGILVLTDRNTISVVREAESNVVNIDLAILYNSLRKNEYLAIVKQHYGDTPDLPNTLLFRECKKLFCQIPVETAHKLTIECLRTRGNNLLLKDYLQQIPASLTAYALNCGSNRKWIESFAQCLERPLGKYLPAQVL